MNTKDKLSTKVDLRRVDANADLEYHNKSENTNTLAKGDKANNVSKPQSSSKVALGEAEMENGASNIPRMKKIRKRKTKLLGAATLKSILETSKCQTGPTIIEKPNVVQTGDLIKEKLSSAPSNSKDIDFQTAV